MCYLVIGNPDCNISLVSFSQQIVDSQKEKAIGKLEFSLMQLLKSENMTVEQPFPLKDSGHNSSLTCRFMLKVNKMYLLQH